MEINQNVFLKYYNKDKQIIIFLLCLKEKKELIKPPKYVLIKIFKNINYLFDESTILNDENHKNMLIKWIKEIENIQKQSSKLIYCSSKNGYTSKKFHEFCDNKLNTISLIKSNNFIFGGFTSISWEQGDGNYGNYKDDPKSFIFSISNPSNQPIKFKYKNDGCSIFCYEDYGPVFGLGNEIDISDYSNKNENSKSDLGYSFEGCPFKYGTKEAQKFLCGSYQFKVQEIEVFQLF